MKYVVEIVLRDVVEPPPPLPPTNPDWLYIGLHDFESSDQVYEDIPAYYPRVYGKTIGLPEVRKFESGTRVSLIETWERFWFELFRLRNASVPLTEIKKAWLSLTHSARAFTNKAGSDIRRSFVCGTNPEQVPMQKEVVSCPGGNLFRAVGAPVTKNGRLCLPVASIDYTVPPPDPVALSQVRWLVHEAVICRPEKVDPAPTSSAPHGTFRCNPFNYRAPVPSIVNVGDKIVLDGIACRVDWMRMSRLRKAGASEIIPSPFVPPISPSPPLTQW